MPLFTSWWLFLSYWLKPVLLYGAARHSQGLRADVWTHIVAWLLSERELDQNPTSASDQLGDCKIGMTTGTDTKFFVFFFKYS